MYRLIHKTLLLCILSLTLISCEKKQSVEAPATPVTATAILSEDVPIFIDTVGHFIAYNHVMIQAQVEGQLLNYFFQEGTEVSEGDLLFTIDPRPYQAALDQAIAVYQKNLASLRFAEDTMIRYSTLVEDNFVSQLDFDKYVTDVDFYRATIKENIAEIEKAEINLGYCTIFSPITGVTGKRLIDQGNLITNAGSDLLVINQVSPLYIDFSIPERYFDKVALLQRKGTLNIEIVVPGADIKTEASLEMINNAIDEKSGMVALRGILPNKERLFWPGQFVRVHLILYVEKDALVVPTSAINIGQQGNFVWKIDKNNTVSAKYVKVGQRFDNKAVISNNIKAGDMVVTKGQLNLRPGKTVVIKNSE